MSEIPLELEHLINGVLLDKEGRPVAATMSGQPDEIAERLAASYNALRDYTLAEITSHKWGEKPKVKQ